jgi:hypothetical protein
MEICVSNLVQMKNITNADVDDDLKDKNKINEISIIHI